MTCPDWTFTKRSRDELKGQRLASCAADPALPHLKLVHLDSRDRLSHRFIFLSRPPPKHQTTVNKSGEQ